MKKRASVIAAACLATVLMWGGLLGTAQAGPPTITSFTQTGSAVSGSFPAFCEVTFDVTWLPSVRRTVIAELFDTTGNLRVASIVPGGTGATSASLTTLQNKTIPSTLFIRLYVWNVRKGDEGRLLDTSGSLAVTVTDAETCAVSAVSA